MLVRAILHEEELTRKHLEAICDDYFMFYSQDSYRSFEFSLEDNDFWDIQMVSLDGNGDVIGYITVNLNRDSKVASSFAMINFTKKINIIFSRDVLKFLKNLRDVHQASKFEFTGIVGGEPELLYRNFIDKYGGRIVGTVTNTVKLVDGNFYDSTIFEIMREDMKF